MALARALRAASRAELRQRIVRGHRIEASALEGYAYRGTSLGLPRALELVAWKIFQKTFFRCPRTGRLLGWNVRLEQRGVSAGDRPGRLHALERQLQQMDHGARAHRRRAARLGVDRREHGALARRHPCDRAARRAAPHAGRERLHDDARLRAVEKKTANCSGATPSSRTTASGPIRRP